MTNNRLPEVGKRYRTKPGFHQAIVFLREIKHEKAIYFSDKSEWEMPIKQFLEIYEKLPNQEQKLREKEEVQLEELVISKTETTDKLSVAKEELRDYLCRSLLDSNCIVTAMQHYRELKEKAHNVLNALDDQNRQEKGGILSQFYNDGWGKGYAAALEDCKLQETLKKQKALDIPEKGGCGIEEDTRSERFAKVKKLIEEGRVFFPKEPDFLKEKDERSDWFYALDWAMNSGKKQVEAEKEIEEENSSDYKQLRGILKEHFPEEQVGKKNKPKSIWKDVSELPEFGDSQFIIKKENGDKEICLYHEEEECFMSLEREAYLYNFGIIKWRYLTDFINSFEQLQDKVEEMEREIRILKAEIRKQVSLKSLERAILEGKTK